MKLSEIKERIRQGEFSEELFAEFQTALKRVPEDLRCQHCYTTAYDLRNTDPQNAIRMIRYGLDSFACSWIDRMRANRNLGLIYEGCKDYTAAREAFEIALSSIPEEKQEFYRPTLSMDILRAQLHCSKFEFTEYAEALYRAAMKADSFTAAFRHFIFYRSIMEIILAKRNHDPAAQAVACRNALLALDCDNVTAMDRLLLQKHHKDDAHATEEALAFLSENRI